MNNKIAIYLRLSLSDGDLKKGSKDESNSIENQRLLLHSYIEKQDDLSGEIVEYVDDGYTGTNFNRPAFQKMIIDLKQGFLAVFVGTDLVQAIVNMVPEWLSVGLNVSTKIMTAYGLALLLTMMIKKGMTPFLFIGFLLAAYLNLSVIAVALIGVCLAIVFMGFKFNGSHAAAGVDSDYDPLEDDED